MARRMLSREERKTNHVGKIFMKDEEGNTQEKTVKYRLKTSPFSSAQWNSRKAAIQKRVQRKIAKEKKRALDRKISKVKN